MVGTPDSRILLLGCGAVGTVAARHLAASRLVGSLTAADVDVGRAKATAAATRSRKVRPLALDLEEDGALRDAIRGASLVINAALPKYNLAIMAATLEADVDYMDLAGGGKAQLALHGKWERAGRTALLGMGEDPGLANVFARHAADAMDEVDAVRIRDGKRAGRIGVGAQLVALDLEGPGLRVVARRREDRPLEQEAEPLRRSGA